MVMPPARARPGAAGRRKLPRIASSSTMGILHEVLRSTNLGIGATRATGEFQHGTSPRNTGREIPASDLAANPASFPDIGSTSYSPPQVQPILCRPGAALAARRGVFGMGLNRLRLSRGAGLSATRPTTIISQDFTRGVAKHEPGIGDGTKGEIQQGEGNAQTA